MERKTPAPGRRHQEYGKFNAAKTHCPQGHEYSPENTYRKVDVFGSVQRHCRACRKANDRERYLRTRKKPKTGWDRWPRNSVIPR